MTYLLITPEEADGMSEEELVSLVFTPGFSTAEQVSNIRNFTGVNYQRGRGSIAQACVVLRSLPNSLF